MMTCAELRARLDAGLDRAAAREVRAHALHCEQCSTLIVEHALTRGLPPTPPEGFAHRTAVTAAMTAAPPRGLAHPGLRTALVVVGIYFLVATLWTLREGLPIAAAGPAVFSSTIASALVAIEAAAVLGLLVGLWQAPPTRRRA
jgi:hypothetical protein